MTEPTIFDLSVPGRKGGPSRTRRSRIALPEGFLREDLPIPEMSEMDAVRHFTSISQKNYAIDLGFYPLGSCTMKYNPRSTKLPVVCLVLPQSSFNRSKVFRATSI